MIDVDGQTETWYYYHFDGLGSVIALSDDNGDLVESYSYNVFGTPTIYDDEGDEISVSSIGNPYMLTGRRYEQETGLYYYRLRDYNPSIGRFMQTDPIGYAGGMNLYRYCHNNPTNYVDPMGLASDRWRPRPELPDPREWLELMRLASFYSNTWGEWPDLTEYDYDWSGASSDSQEPTKGKVLTLSMLLKAMLECYENHILGKEDDDIINFWMNVDTIFFNAPYNSTLYNYNGNVYRGGEINYIGAGMALRHFKKNKYSIVYYPLLHNLNKLDARLPTSGEIYFTKLGFLYYPLIRDWHQRRQNNIR